MNEKMAKNEKDRYKHMFTIIPRAIVLFHLVLAEYFLQKGKNILAIM